MEQFTKPPGAYTMPFIIYFKAYCSPGLQSISWDVADNVSYPRRLDPTMEQITHSFVLYLQHGRHDVNANHQYVQNIVVTFIYAIKGVKITCEFLRATNPVFKSHFIFQRSLSSNICIRSIVHPLRRTCNWKRIQIITVWSISKGSFCLHSVRMMLIWPLRWISFFCLYIYQALQNVHYIFQGRSQS